MLIAKSTGKMKVELAEVPVPNISDDEVLIKIKKVGICGSDIQIYHGLHKYMTFPVIQGHEGGGIVEKTGKNITHVKVGDKVVIQPQYFCGECYACKKGRYNVCESIQAVGVHADGFFAEYYVAPAWNVLKVPDEMSYEDIALLEPLAVGFAGAAKAGAVPGKRIVVIGDGTIGNFTAQACKAVGAEVMITGVSDEKLNMARNQGINFTINTSATDLAEAINKCFRGKKADAIIDCVAIEATINQAIDCAANSSKIVVTGNFKEPLELEFPRLQRREVELLSIMMYVRSDFEKAIHFLSKKEVRTEGIITKQFPLKDIDKAYQWIDENRNNVMKTLIVVDEE